MDAADLLAPRLLLVTGKGGVGKSSVSAAIATAAVTLGLRTCLVEVEGRQTFSTLFATPQWGFEPQEFRPDLLGVSIDPDASLQEYLAQFYGAKRLSRLVVGSTAVDFATSAAPGIKDVLLVGKVKDMERQRNADGRFTYDLIVMDAPPTGRIVNFLRAPEATIELVNVGPIRAQAQQLVDLLVDPERTNIVLTTLLEEMPVQETIESVEALEALGVTVGPIMVNRVLPERLDADQAAAIDREDVDTEALVAALEGAHVPVSTDDVAELVELGRAHLRRRDLQAEMRARLADTIALPTVELPALATRSFGPEQITELARVIEEVAT